MKYPFLQLKDSNSQYSTEIKAAINRVVDSGWYLNGTENQQFEEELRKSCGAAYAIGVSNGLDALRLILRAYIELGKINEGDDIIVPANTYIATILAITDNRLNPILVEPDEATFNLNIDYIEKAITHRTKAILVVHLYGTPCWSKKLKEIAKKHNLIIIEDNAQAIGAKANCVGINSESYITGALGNVAAFSFYPTKNIGALGDAGAITTSDRQIAETVRALANYGSDRRYHNIYRGYNCRMDELQAAILRIKLKNLHEETQRRITIAETYNRHIYNQNILKPIIFSDIRQVWHQYVIRAKNRQSFIDFLAKNQVGYDIHYAVPPHLQPCYNQTLKGNYPLTEILANEVVSLPIANLSTSDAIEISQIINSF